MQLVGTPTEAAQGSEGPVRTTETGGTLGLAGHLE